MDYGSQHHLELKFIFVIHLIPPIYLFVSITVYADEPYLSSDRTGVPSALRVCSQHPNPTLKAEIYLMRTCILSSSTPEGTRGLVRLREIRWARDAFDHVGLQISQYRGGSGSSV